MKVSAIQTGTITIKRCHLTCCLPRRALMAARFAAILADRRWADPMPIWTFVIEHSEGTFLVDAGATPAYDDDASWRQDPRAGKMLLSFLRIEVEESETLPAQLIDHEGGRRGSGAHRLEPVALALADHGGSSC